MRRQLTGIVSIAALLIMASASAFSQEPAGKETGKGGVKAQEPAKGERINAFMVQKIIGSRVLNMHGEELGTISDVVIDVDSGRVLYAVMQVGQFLGLGGKLFPIPWHALAPLPSEGVFFLNISKEKLQEAPGYDRNNLPDMGDVHWGTEIANFYHVPRVERYYDYQSGLMMYPNIAQKDPFAETFDQKSMKTIQGEVIKVDKVVPKSGSLIEMQVKLIVFTKSREAVPVYLGPDWYVTGPSRIIPFKSGDQITVSGSWINAKPEPFLIATSVTQDHQTLKLRNPDGSPVWNAWERVRSEYK